MYVRVAINIPTDKVFSYAVPSAMAGGAVVGKLVQVPVGKRVLTGYILEIISAADVENIKEIIKIYDNDPYFNEEELLFYRWVSQYYLYPLGKMLSEVLPTPVSPKKEKVIALDPGYLTTVSCRLSKKLYAVDTRENTFAEEEVLHALLNQDTKLSDQQALFITFLLKNGSVSLVVLRREFKNANYLVGCLQKKGLVCLKEQESCRSLADLPALESVDHKVLLNDDQEGVLREVLPSLAVRRFSPYLLHGVTGSGKTEIYLRLMAAARERGGGVISLVPEISLTPQLIARVRGRFKGQEIAIIHSGISRSQRAEQWQRIQKGEVKIAIGARSALFVPMRDLRLIIVDEEHDGSYKQDERLRYNARDMAIVKAKQNAAAVVLGSATPAIQSYFNARKKKYHYLTLPNRVESRDLPVFNIVDMKNSCGEENFEVPILSKILREEMSRTLSENKQILLFLNRRGFDTVVLCLDCGYIFKCLNCELTLTHHAALGMLRCHYCDYAIKAASLCPSCSGKRLRSYGLGTEKLEEEAKRLFPSARVGRMDSDTTARRGDGERILRMLARQELDILVGTQMIAKGHDFPSITLVGVVAADLSLNVPDFRAGERTFQMLTQVAGRGGRGDVPGLVVVQTFNPDHYAVRRAQNHDYHGFYEDEIKLRKSLRYPPYVRLINLQISSANKDRGRAGIDIIGRLAKHVVLNKQLATVEILGPAEAPVSKIRGRYRWQILLKGGDTKAQIIMVDIIRAEAAKRGLEVKVDVDPMNFM